MGITISVTHHPVTKLDLGILSNGRDGHFFIPKEFFVLGSFLKLFDALFDLLPPASEVWRKVIFVHLFFILFKGRGGTRAWNKKLS